MTVSFTTSPIKTATGPSVGDLIWPLVHSKDYASTTDETLLRYLARALGNGVSAVGLRYWLVANIEDPKIRSAVLHPGRWFPLVSASRRWLAESVSDAGAAAARLEVARRWVARVCTPLPAGRLSWAKQVNARLALGVIAETLIRTGWTKALCTSGFLGQQLGWTQAHAAGVLKTLEKDLGWIRRAGRQQGGALRWQLTRLGGDLGEEMRDRSWLLADAIDALAAQRPGDNYLATVLASGTAPAWHYSESADGKRILGGKAWVALVHAHAGLARDQGLGLRSRTLATMRKELEADLPGALAGEMDLDQALADVAEFTGAHDRRAAADVKAAADAEANRQRVAEFQLAKAAKFELGKAVRRQFREAHHIDGPLGPPPVDTSEVQAWVGQAARFWIEGAGAGLVEPAGIPVARELLVKALVDVGHGQELADKAALFVFRDEPAA